MLKYIVTFLFFLFINSAYSQIKRELNPNVNSCGWNQSEKLTEVYEWETNPDDAARKYVQMICDEENIQPNFIIRRANVDFALSTMDKDNNRIIYYSLYFFQSTESEWCKLGVLAHEIGHIINYHNLDGSKKRPLDELVADEYAGFILAKLNAPLEDIKKLMDIKCATQGDDYYPPKSARLEALAKGYEKGKKLREEDKDEKEKLFRKQNALKMIDCSEFYTKHIISSNEFDEKNYITEVNGIDCDGILDGHLEVARESWMSRKIYDYSTLNNYEFETQIEFNYKGTSGIDDIDKQQFFIWDGNISQHVKKGYYFSILKTPTDDRKYSLNSMEIGYKDGDALTPLKIFSLDDPYLFITEKYLSVIIRKFQNAFYVFVDGNFKEKITLNSYTPGSIFCIVNDVEAAVNSYNEIYSNQLDYNYLVKVNFIHLSSISEK